MRPQARDHERIGRFSVSARLLNKASQGEGKEYDTLRKIFEKVVVFNAKPDIYRDCIEYIAFSHLFDFVDRGADIPEYYARIEESKESGEVSISFERVE